MDQRTRNTVYGIAMDINFKDIKEFRNKLERISYQTHINCTDIEEERYLDLAEPGQIGAGEDILSRLRSLKKYKALTELGVPSYAMRILEIDNLTSLAIICTVDRDNPLIFVLSPNTKTIIPPKRIKSKNASWQTPFSFWRTINQKPSLIEHM